MRATRKKCTALRSDRRGVAAMEFALLLPLMTAMMCGIFQYGVLMLTYNSMLNAARDGARALAIGTSNEAQVASTAKAKLPQWVPQTSWTIVAADTASTGSSQVRTSISVPSNDATFLPFVPMPAEISVNVVMQKES